eukprot:TRINITY_DN12617_c0_g1_i1.p1 TRINITY_DN12617_c0_g1~~TRINITY_DN12617_c0_g1_i1.p1  ORF type:complete len:142 (+),score=26.31 TRINITY_DN12617_c0_g1_i1:97-522(+)
MGNYSSYCCFVYILACTSSTTEKKKRSIKKDPPLLQTSPQSTLFVSRPISPKFGGVHVLHDQSPSTDAEQLNSSISSGPGPYIDNMNIWNNPTRYDSDQDHHYTAIPIKEQTTSTPVSTDRIVKPTRAPILHSPKGSPFDD